MVTAAAAAAAAVAARTAEADVVLLLRLWPPLPLLQLLLLDTAADPTVVPWCLSHTSAPLMLLLLLLTPSLLL